MSTNHAWLIRKTLGAKTEAGPHVIMLVNGESFSPSTPMSATQYYKKNKKKRKRRGRSSLLVITKASTGAPKSYNSTINELGRHQFVRQESQHDQAIWTHDGAC